MYGYLLITISLVPVSSRSLPDSGKSFNLDTILKIVLIILVADSKDLSLKYFAMATMSFLAIMDHLINFNSHFYYFHFNIFMAY